VFLVLLIPALHFAPALPAGVPTGTLARIAQHLMVPVFRGWRAERRPWFPRRKRRWEILVSRFRT